MRALRVLVILAIAGAVASAEPVSLQLSTRYDLGSGLLERGELRSGDFRVAMAGGPDVPILAGVSCPWLRAGPLSPAGILREAANPLAFQAGSDVFVERTAFVLEESFPAPPSGVLLMPVSRSLGVFCRSLADGGQWIGVMASAFHRPGVSVEGFLSMANPPAQTAGEEWLSAQAPFAGGRVLSSAGRLLVETGPLGLAATMGISQGELVPPGTFCHFHASLRTGVLGLYLLLGTADTGYTSPAGEHPAETRMASAALRLSSSQGSADLRVSQATGHPSFSPHPFLAARSEASFEVERMLPLPGETLLRACLQGSTIIHADPDGAREASRRCSALLGVHVSPFRVEAGSGWSSVEGASADVSAQAALDRRGSRVALDASLPFSALLALRLAGPGFLFTVGAGWEDQGPRFSAAWSVRDSLP